MRRERLLEPADVELVHRRHHLAHVGHRIAGVGVGQDRDIVAEAAAHRRHARDVGLDVVADAELQRLVARLDHRHGFGRQRIGRLVAERDAAGIGRHRPVRAAEQLVERPAGRLALDVPQRLVEPAHRHRGGGARAVAAELHLVDPRPDARRVGRIHAEHQSAQGSVHEMADRARRPRVMALAPADDAVLGRHLDQHAVALGHGADAERDLVLLRDAEGGREGFDVDDFHFTPLLSSRTLVILSEARGSHRAIR